MFKSDRIRKAPYLNYAFISYLLLGTTDTVHHFHAATALSNSAAIPPAMIGVVLVPTAIFAVKSYVNFGSKKLLWVFLAIATLAIAIPGFYHGGWNHLVKVLAHLRIDSPSTNIASLFPSQNLNLWFYEITGLLEFLFAVTCSYFLYMLIKKEIRGEHRYEIK